MSFNLNCSWFAPFQTFYIAEQVSHHPPISAFYVTNRREGFTVASSILAKSKFYGTVHIVYINNIYGPLI